VVVGEAAWADLEATVLELARTVRQECGTLREKIAPKVGEMEAQATSMIDRLREIFETFGA